MMNTKVAAIAITLIVAIPIMLGYGLAFEEETVTGWQSTDVKNITDLMLNSQTPYYLDTASVANNSELLTERTNDHATDLVAPGYVSVSENPTSIPIMTSVDSTLTDGNATTTTTTSGTTITVAGATLTAGIDFAADPTDVAAYYITSTQTATLYYYGGSMTGTAFGPFVASSDSTYSWETITVGSASDPDNFRFEVDSSSTFTITSSTFYPLWPASVVDISYFTVTYPYPIIVRSGSFFYHATAASNTVTYNNGTMTVGGYTLPASTASVAAADLQSHPVITYSYTLSHNMAAGTSYSMDLSSSITTEVATEYQTMLYTYADLPFNSGDYYDHYGALYVRAQLAEGVWDSDMEIYLATGADIDYQGHVEGSFSHDNGDYMDFIIWNVGGNLYRCSWDPSVLLEYDHSAGVDLGLYMKGIDPSEVTVTTNACKWSEITFPANYDVMKVVFNDPDSFTNVRLDVNDYLFNTTPGYAEVNYESDEITIYDGFGNVDDVYTAYNNPIYISSAIKPTGTTLDSTIYATYTETLPATWVYQGGTTTTSGVSNTKTHITWADLSLDGVGYFSIEPKMNGFYTDSYLEYNGGTYFSQNRVGYFLRSGSDTFIWNGMTIDSTHFDLSAEVGTTFTIKTRPYYTIVSDNDYSFGFWSDDMSILLIHPDSSVSYVTYQPASQIMETSVVKTGNIVTFNGISYPNVSSVAISSTAVNYYLTELTRSSDYADPSYGWRLVNQNNVNQYWLNGSVNQSVTFMIQMANGESVHLVPIDGSNNAADGVWLTMLNNSIYLGQDTSGERLGEYSLAQIVLTGSSATVSGLKSWPDLATAATVYNTLSVDFTNTVDDFTRVLIDAPFVTEFRVDSASVLAGTFPSIKNNTLNIGQLWPDKSFSVRISSSGIYGDSVTFAGQTYAVSDGAITVNGSKVRLLQSVFSTIKTDDGYVNSINGTEINTTPTASDLTLGGEWSLTLSGTEMEEVERTELEWQPGEFAFNGVDSDFALMGLLGCIVTFVGLGLYGARSGAKVGTLMIICGCAAFVFLAIM